MALIFYCCKKGEASAICPEQAGGRNHATFILFVQKPTKDGVIRSLCRKSTLKIAWLYLVVEAVNALKLLKGKSSNDNAFQ